MPTSAAPPIGFPLSRTSIVANSSLTASRRSANRQINLARWVGGVNRHSSNARPAGGPAPPPPRAERPPGGGPRRSPLAGRRQRRLGELLAGGRVHRRQPLVGLDEGAIDV